MKKYHINLKIIDLRDKRHVYLIIISLNDIKDILPAEDVMEFAEKLSLDIKTLDHVYRGYDIREFVSNKYFDLSLFYLDPSSVVSLSVICKNKAACKKLDKVIEEFKQKEDPK